MDFLATAVLMRLRLDDLLNARPSIDALFRVHRTFIELVPDESVDIQLGRPPPIDPNASLQRVLAGAGGYC